MNTSFTKIRQLQMKWNHWVKTQLRRASIFHRLNITFLLLLLVSTLFLTFFAFFNIPKKLTLI